ncbi:MAG: hypothetical protein ACTHKX_10410 [Pseudolysinimonas sp.]
MSSTAAPSPSRAARALAPLIGVTSLGVLLQAVTAGVFMALRRDGGEAWVGVHDMIANVTVLVAIAAAVVALIAVRRTRPTVAWGSLVLALLLIAQTLVGHLMADAEIDGLVALHVPLAMIVFGATIWLSVATTRRASAG